MIVTMEQGPDELERDEDVSREERDAEVNRLSDQPLDSQGGAAERSSEGTSPPSSGGNR